LGDYDANFICHQQTTQLVSDKLPNNFCGNRNNSSNSGQMEELIAMFESFVDDLRMTWNAWKSKRIADRMQRERIAYLREQVRRADLELWQENAIAAALETAKSHDLDFVDMVRVHSILETPYN
jgi:hypothetical protein